MDSTHLSPWSLSARTRSEHSRLKVTSQRYSKTGVALEAMAFYLYWWFVPTAILR